MMSLFKLLELSNKASVECSSNPSKTNADKLEKMTDMVMKYIVENAERKYLNDKTDVNLKHYNEVKNTYLRTCK
jgi:hypothetical protein